MSEKEISDRDRGYKDGAAGITPTDEDAGNEPYRDGYKLGFLVFITEALK